MNNALTTTSFFTEALNNMMEIKKNSLRINQEFYKGILESGDNPALVLEASDGLLDGIKNIIAHLGHDTFMRIKVGVGEKPAGYDLADYVLGHFSKEDRSVMEEAFREAADAVEMMISEGPDAAMNAFNKKK